jgi:hypothetical protein
MNDVVKGTAFAVVATPEATDDDHPEGTWVPPKGSDDVSGPSMMTETGGTTQHTRESRPIQGTKHQQITRQQATVQVNNRNSQLALTFPFSFYLVRNFLS